MQKDAGNLLATILTACWLSFGSSEVIADQLVIDQEIVPLSIVEAYGKSTIERRDYCPPVSDKYVLDTFIRDALIARKSSAFELAQYTNTLELTLQPLLLEIEKLHGLISSNYSNHDAIEIYRKQIRRIESDIDNVVLDSHRNFRRYTQFSGTRFDRLNALHNLSIEDKYHIKKIIGYADLHKSKIRDGISDAVIQQHYDKLVEKKDKRLVNVHVFKHRSLYLSSCLLYTSPSPRDATLSRMPSSA